MLSFIGAGLRFFNLNSHLVSNELSGENMGFQINLPTCGYPSFWFDANPKNKKCLPQLRKCAKPLKLYAIFALPERGTKEIKHPTYKANPFSFGLILISYYSLSNLTIHKKYFWAFDGQRSTKSSNFTQNSMYRYFITYFDLSTSLRVSPLAQMRNVSSRCLASSPTWPDWLHKLRRISCSNGPEVTRTAGAVILILTTPVINNLTTMTDNISLDDAYLVFQKFAIFMHILKFSFKPRSHFCFIMVYIVKHYSGIQRLSFPKFCLISLRRIMELSVLSSVTVILNYVLQCINGGLLNVFFTPTYNQTSKQTTYEFGMNQDRLMKYVKGVLTISGKDLPLDVLKTFPESIGGGDKGVKEAQENPNREVIFIIGPVAAAIIMLIAILGLVLISFCTYATKCCHSHKKKKPKSGDRGNKLSAKSAKSSEVAEVPAVEEHKETHQDLPYKRQFDNGYDGYPYYGNEDYKDSGSDSDDSEDDDTTTSKDDDPKVTDKCEWSNKYLPFLCKNATNDTKDLQRPGIKKIFSLLNTLCTGTVARNNEHHITDVMRTLLKHTLAFRDFHEDERRLIRQRKGTRAADMAQRGITWFGTTAKSKVTHHFYLRDKQHCITTDLKGKGRRFNCMTWGTFHERTTEFEKLSCDVLQFLFFPPPSDLCFLLPLVFLRNCVANDQVMSKYEENKAHWRNEDQNVHSTCRIKNAVLQPNVLTVLVFNPTVHNELLDYEDVILHKQITGIHRLFAWPLFQCAGCDSAFSTYLFALGYYAVNVKHSAIEMLHEVASVAVPVPCFCFGTNNSVGRRPRSVVQGILLDESFTDCLLQIKYLNQKFLHYEKAACDDLWVSNL
ncbi:hypothetical protein EGR_10084 [Echinococcus granulosus]|uniref:Uncharacterized protein n=1 Tax=Echinococcus granulosus TaxID=6210 RepID=W6U1Z3_ECHGR|nr:hypothetical protein EGR_10084 [Echinococcus granulosus]EUB55063.1 hypothetical protein EGR_10084 [Echinococcus granulosus]